MNKLSRTNSTVLQIKCGHPGYADHQIIATRDTMRTLIAGVLQKLDAAGDKTCRVESIECTLAHERADHIYVSFHTASQEDMEKYHTRIAAVRLRKAVKFTYHIVVFCLALYGVSRLLGRP